MINTIVLTTFKSKVMKSVLKRRKHRKGIRPIRKGTLKVRMVEFPSHLLQSSLMSAIFKRVSKVGHDILVSPNENRAQKNHAYWTYRGFYDKANKGYDFVKTHKQINPLDLALDVINYVDPIYVKTEQQDNKCNRCRLNKECSLKEIGDLKCISKVCSLWHNIVAPFQVELNTAEMAELALTHLS